MGNDDNTSMGKVSGGSKPARLWHDYMQGAIGLDLPSFVTTFSAPSSFGSFFGFGDSDYAPQPMANVPQGNGTDGGGFGSMLKYWSSGSGGNDGEVVPNNKPVYNP
jgi:penicillin-binding protein 1A